MSPSTGTAPGRGLKMLLPSFRTRYLRIFDALERHLGGRRVERILNVGCGEGDYDLDLLLHADRVEAGDINPDDVAYCRAARRDPRLSYRTLDVEQLRASFAPETFDAIACIDVIEHVGSIPESLESLHAVLRPGGLFVVTVPIARYPSAYDPLNAILAIGGDRGRRRLPLGAFAYGHETLVDEDDLERRLVGLGFEVLERQYLSHHLVGLAEMYWAGLAQWAFKQNSRNATRRSDPGALLVRPDAVEPPRAAIALVDALVALDERLFAGSRSAIGVLLVARKGAAPDAVR